MLAVEWVGLEPVLVEVEFREGEFLLELELELALELKLALSEVGVVAESVSSFASRDMTELVSICGVEEEVRVEVWETEKADSDDDWGTEVVMGAKELNWGTEPAVGVDWALKTALDWELPPTELEVGAIE